ncbi:hypothetical protein KCU76_g100, partial [Aureobasidium melanogenum]
LCTRCDVVGIKRVVSQITEGIVRGLLGYEGLAVARGSWGGRSDGSVLRSSGSGSLRVGSNCGSCSDEGSGVVGDGLSSDADSLGVSRIRTAAKLAANAGRAYEEKRILNSRRWLWIGREDETDSELCRLQSSYLIYHSILFIGNLL